MEFYFFINKLVLTTQGLVAGGSAEVTSGRIEPVSGGAYLGGSAQVGLTYISFGGLLASGTFQSSAVINEPPNGQVDGGLFADSSADLSTSLSLSFNSTGNIVETGGSASVGLKGVRYRGSGTIVVGSDNVVNFVFNKDMTFLWHVRTKIEKDLTFFWNVGQLEVFWYRVVSKGIDGSQPCPIQGNPCCQKYIVTLHARTPAELCQKLSKRLFKFPIESVQRFTRPAENSQITSDAAEGIDNECQQLVPVDICGIPACADFCVDLDLKTVFGFASFAQVNAFHTVEWEGMAFTGGAASYSYTKNLPSLSYVAVSGPQTGGAAICVPNSFTGSGGSVLGGSASTRSSRWQYIGGVWPDKTQRCYGIGNQSVLVQVNDQPWQLSNRVNVPDGLLAQADVSFKRKSQRLITTGFNLQIPSSSSVLGLYVRLNRVATQTNIRDLEVYLVRNNEVISDNLANTNSDWPFLATERVYGSNGIDSFDPWLDPNGDHYSGPLTSVDLNDPTFGILVRVVENASVSAALAKIDYINIEAYYEDAQGSIVRMGGTASARAPKYHYVGGLGYPVLLVDSLAIAKMKFRYRSNGLDQAAAPVIQPGGRASIGFYDYGVGGSRIGGEAKVTPYMEFPVGAANMNGEAKVTPFFEVMTGGLRAAGGSVGNVKIRYTMSGGPHLESSTFTPEVQYDYVMTGGTSLSSLTFIRSNHWVWVSDGNVAFVLGSADQRPGSFVIPPVITGFGITILQTTASFESDVDKQDAQILTGTVNKCGCMSIPLTVNLTQNYARDNLFAQFLVRNSYSLPSILKLRYNIGNDSWQCNLHYRGQSAESSAPESWDLVFELQCTDSVGGIGIGTSIWKLATQIFRKNLVTRESFDTRVIVSVIPDAICASTGAALNFSVVYDTQSDVAVVTPTAVVYQNTIYDNIGLFRNQSWIAAPDLKLSISQASQTQPVNRVDVTDAVLID